MKDIRVVLVEDDLHVARVNRDLLEASADVHVIGTATSCAEGDQLVRNLRPDLVLLDVYLPDGTGLALLRNWRERGELVEVIMVTAADDMPAIREALAHGAFDYLIKPFTKARLADAVQRYRARRGSVKPTFDQQQLDRYLGVTAAGAPVTPKGIDLRTLERVATVLAEHAAPMSAEEVGAHVGLSRVTTWRYLEYLVEAGRATLDYQYGVAGRPSKLYRVVPGSHSPDR